MTKPGFEPGSASQEFLICCAYVLSPGFLHKNLETDFLKLNERELVVS